MAMDYKDFSPEIWKLITDNVEKAITKPGPHYAAFDADGTLWDNDAGNAFFNYEIENKLVPLPDDPWKYVYSLKDEDPRKAFLWLAQIHKGLPLETVQKWAEESHLERSINYFPAIKKLIEYLKSKNVEVYVVTASVKWAVEPCVKKLGIPPSHVLGVQTVVQNGIITDIQDGPVTYREGKSEALLEKTKNIPPILSCGNTMGDYWLLDMATDIKLSVRTEGHAIAYQDGDILNQEKKLYEKAKQMGWITHNFA